MAKALQLTGNSEAEESAHFAEMMDKFFDCVNVHNYTQGYHKRKAFQNLYRSLSDPRLKVYTHHVLCYPNRKCMHFLLQWLEDDFLGYLDQWEKSVKVRQGFSKKEKARMLLSPATMLGLRMTSKAYLCFLLCNTNIFTCKSIFPQLSHLWTW